MWGVLQHRIKSSPYYIKDTFGLSVRGFAKSFIFFSLNPSIYPRTRDCKIQTFAKIFFYPKSDCLPLLKGPFIITRQFRVKTLTFFQKFIWQHEKTSSLNSHERLCFWGISQIISQKFRVCTSHLVATRMAKSEPLILRFFRIATKNSPLQGSQVRSRFYAYADIFLFGRKVNSMIYTCKQLQS